MKVATCGGQKTEFFQRDALSMSMFRVWQTQMSRQTASRLSAMDIIVRVMRPNPFMHRLLGSFALLRVEALNLK
jgi:hypothetical protein